MTNLEKVLVIAKKVQGRVYENYSGRGMFGKQCLGVVTTIGNVDEAVRLGKKAGFTQPSRDELGKNTIVYWPSVKLDVDFLSEDRSDADERMEDDVKAKTKKAEATAKSGGKVTKIQLPVETAVVTDRKAEMAAHKLKVTPKVMAEVERLMAQSVEVKKAEPTTADLRWPADLNIFPKKGKVYTAGSLRATVYDKMPDIGITVSNLLRASGMKKGQFIQVLEKMNKTHGIWMKK